MRAIHQTSPLVSVGGAALLREKGAITGSSVMEGAFLAKRYVPKMDPNVFRLVMDGIMLIAGASMLWNAATTPT